MSAETVRVHSIGQPPLYHSSPLYEMVKEGIDLKSIQWSQH